MVQNHLMQLLSLVAMEPPTEFSAASVRDRKMDALLAVQPIVGGDEPPAVVRAQYREGWVAGAEVPAYRAEPGVAPDSTTETFVALRLQLDSWRWAGVPFYLRTGKRLPKRTTEIAIQFHRPPLQIFKRVSPTPLPSDLLVINVQPDEGISLRFNAKIPGTRMQVAPVMMNFRYGTSFAGEVPEAYETLLLDAMLGDPTLFARHDFVEASWALVTPINEYVAAESADPPDLRGGRVGPARSGCAHRKGWPPMENAVTGAAPGRARTATVVAVGPAECLGDARRDPERRRRRGRAAHRADRRSTATARACRRIGRMWSPSAGCAPNTSTTPLPRSGSRACRRSSGGEAAGPRSSMASRRWPIGWCSTPTIRGRSGRARRRCSITRCSPTCAGPG